MINDWVDFTATLAKLALAQASRDGVAMVSLPCGEDDWLTFGLKGQEESQ